MKLQLKIRQKGLIIVAVPVLLELILLLSLAALLHQAEGEIQQEVQSREAVMHANVMLRHLVSAGTRLLSYYMKKNPKSLHIYQKRKADVKEEIEALKSLYSDQPAQLALLAETDRDVDHLFEVFNKFEGFADQPVSVVSMLRGQTFFGEMQKSIDRVSDDLNPLIVAAQEVVISSPTAQMRHRHQIQAVIFGGVLLTVLLAFYLTSLFSKGITRRLQYLTDNTDRLAKQMTLAPALEGTDEIAHLDRVFHDMADTVAKAAQLEREAAERVRRIITSLPVGLLIVERNGQINFANSTTETMFGYSSDELIGQNITYMIDRNKTRNPAEFMEQVHSKWLGKLGELIASKRSGETFPVQFSLSELQMPEGPKLLAILLDITERYEIQKLRQAFVAMVSHDLRTPLTSVQNFLTLLTMGAYGDMPQKAAEKADVQEKNIQRLIALINDLLDLEKIESGVIQLNPAPTSIHSVINHSVESLSTLAERNSVRIDITPSDDELKITADGDRLVQVVTNLISNAIKYSQSGDTVTVSAHGEPDLVEVRVKDRGPGIPQEHREIIFERFQQVKSADGIERAGTGLGLAICKTIVEQHGGSIGVDSEIGKGSEFWFRIPRESGAEPANS